MTSWQLRAACRTEDSELFYDRTTRAQALALCSGCPVRAECLEDALQAEEPWDVHGVRGGLTEHQRRRLLRTGTTAAAALAQQQQREDERRQRVRRQQLERPPAELEIVRATVVRTARQHAAEEPEHLCRKECFRRKLSNEAARLLDPALDAEVDAGRLERVGVGVFSGFRWLEPQTVAVRPGPPQPTAELIAVLLVRVAADHAAAAPEHLCQRTYCFRPHVSQLARVLVSAALELAVDSGRLALVGTSYRWLGRPEEPHERLLALQHGRGAAVEVVEVRVLRIARDHAADDPEHLCRKGCFQRRLSSVAQPHLGPVLDLAVASGQLEPVRAGYRWAGGEAGA